MKSCRNFKFATEFGSLFELERKKAEIVKYFIIQNCEMVIENLILWKVWSENQMPADNIVIKLIYHICHHIFGEVITPQDQEKFHFIIHNGLFQKKTK